MLKLIIFSLLGRKVVSSRVMFNSIKSYLIVYLLILPALLSAGAWKSNSRSSDEFMKNVPVESPVRVDRIQFHPETDQLNSAIGKVNLLMGTEGRGH